MKLFRLLIIAFPLLLLPAAMSAQQDENVDKYFDESQGFTHRLWYGGGFTLWFGGINGASRFETGISPMVGYKITKEWSVGPRFSLLYINYRENLGPFVAKANLVNYGIGAFTRYKVFGDFFIHLEYGADNEEWPTNGPVNSDNQIPTVRRLRSNGFIGAGINQSIGGLLGADIYVLYNALLPENDFRSAFDIRFGVT